jgi:hypothetical protein
MLMAVPRLLHLCIIFYLCRVREDMGAARACLCALASVFLLFLSVQTELHPKTENLENILSEKKRGEERKRKIRTYRTRQKLRLGLMVCSPAFSMIWPYWANEESPRGSCSGPVSKSHYQLDIWPKE